MNLSDDSKHTDFNKKEKIVESDMDPNKHNTRTYNNNLIILLNVNIILMTPLQPNPYNFRTIMTPLKVEISHKRIRPTFMNIRKL